jgi:hypothetical protein
MTRCATWLMVVLLMLALPVAAAPAFSIAFDYGPRLNGALLRAHDIVVVDPDQGHRPGALGPDTRLFAYVSIGEVHPQRAYAPRIPAALKRVDNTDWGSTVIDVSAPAWADFLLEQVLAPLWAAGYRGFFFDTLDSYQLDPSIDPEAARHGLETLIERVAARFPGVQLILNRGFELLPRVHAHVHAVAAESLHRGWDPARRQYRPVPEADRQWLRARFDEVRSRYRLPVIAIDYLPGEALDEARALARRMLAEDVIPWIAEPALTSAGTGAMEALPRTVLVVYDPDEAGAINYTNAHRYIEMPLNYLGYVAHYVPVGDALPERLDPRQYAGVVTWMTGGIRQGPRLQRWLLGQIRAGLPVAVLDDFGFELTPAIAHSLGLVAGAPLEAPLSLDPLDPSVGFETMPRPEAARVLPLRAEHAEAVALARIRDARGAIAHPGAIMPWGGFLLDPLAVTELPGTEGQSRWGTDPFDFLRRALRLPPRPVPDPTSASGRRLLMIHVDGDGFPSLGEFSGSPPAAQVLLDDVLRRYRLPHAMSVIEAEVNPAGLYPALAARMEGIARQMFALPHVEIASHTYSHPFKWRKVFGDPDPDGGGYALAIPGYTPDPEREILGAMAYIRERLAPAGKPVRLLLWSGNAAPDERTLALIEANGLLDLNGGNTTISRRRPTVAAASPLGVFQGPYFQTYAPVMNENVYTNDWTGPFYGFRDVIDTFRMTGEPRRLKPVGIYYHTYSASKQAALKALHQVYDWALAQPLHPVYPSEYVRMARNFNSLSLARRLDDPDTLHLRQADSLRSLRLPPALAPLDLARSPGVAGVAPGPDGAHATLVASRAELRFAAHPAPSRFVSANARLVAWRAEGDTMHFELEGRVPLAFTLSLTDACRLYADARALRPVRRDGTDQHFELPGTHGRFRLHCPG